MELFKEDCLCHRPLIRNECRLEVYYMKNFMNYPARKFHRDNKQTIITRVHWTLYIVNTTITKPIDYRIMLKNIYDSNVISYNKMCDFKLSICLNK